MLFSVRFYYDADGNKPTIFFFRQGREIIITNGYVKKQQKVDTRELERARMYKKDWEERQK